MCFVFFLGLLGFELETATANTGSTLLGLKFEAGGAHEASCQVDCRDSGGSADRR